ncbi:MAG: hypothetical protein H7844_15095 [Nitrospirae bacterium YQR-1]
MKPLLPATQELLNVARRVVWFKEPQEALSDPVHFLAHVMTYGTIEDLAAIESVAGKEEFCEVLDTAPPGIFDKHSWNYWNLKCGRKPTPPLPVRSYKQSPKIVPLTENSEYDELLQLAGIGSSGLGDLAENHDKYLYNLKQ